MKTSKVICWFVVILLLLGLTSVSSAENKGSKWELMSYVDDFDLPTGNYYICGESESGTYSDSYNSYDLDVIVLIQRTWVREFGSLVLNEEKFVAEEHDDDFFRTDTIELRFFVYDWVITPFDSYGYDVKMMDSEGKRYEFRGSTGNPKHRDDPEMSIYSYDFSDLSNKNKNVEMVNSQKDIIDILKKGGTVEFAIIGRNNSEKIRFSLNADGFAEIYDQYLKTKEEKN